MWRCNNFSKYARDTQVSTLKKFSSFLFLEQSGLGNGMVGTGVHGKRKAQVRHGRQGGATFPSSGHCIISSSFFPIFQFSTPKHGARLVQYHNKNHNYNNTQTRYGLEETRIFLLQGFITARGGTEGKLLGGNLTTFLPHWGAIRIGNFTHLGSTRGGISSTLVRMKLDMTGLIVLFRLIFFWILLLFSTSRLLSFFGLLLFFLFSHWFIFTKSACF